MDQLREDSIEVTFGAGSQNMELQPECAGRRLHVLRGGLGKRGIGWIDEQGHDARRGDQLVQQLQPLRRCLHVRLGHARDIAARPAKAGDETEPDWVAARFEDDRNGRGCRLCRKRRGSAGRGNHGNLTMNQIGRHRRQPIILAFRPTVFDRYVLAIYVTSFAQPFEKGGQVPRIALGGSGIHEPNYRHLRLLGASRERPGDYWASNDFYEITPLHMCPRQDHALWNA
jgi:hypothetical protein